MRNCCLRGQSILTLLVLGCVSFVGISGLPEVAVSRIANNNAVQRNSPLQSQHGQRRGIASESDNLADLEQESKQITERKFDAWAAAPYFQSSTGLLYIIGLVMLTLMNSGCAVVSSYIRKDIWNAFATKDVVIWNKTLKEFIGFLLIRAPVAATYRYVREQLAVHWREWITTRSLQLYSSNRVYYNLDSSSDLDNPDQRITEDTNTFATYSVELFNTLLSCFIDLVAFSVILYRLSPKLVLAVVLYTCAGNLVTAWIARTLVSLKSQQLQKEADLRYLLIRLQENAESVAFYAGEQSESYALEKQLKAVTDNKRLINSCQQNLEFVTADFRYLAQILPVLVMAPKFFSGEIELGIISQATIAFKHILDDLSFVVNQFESLSTFLASRERLAIFFKAIRRADLQRDENSATTTLVGTPGFLVAQVSSVQDPLSTKFSTISLHRNLNYLPYQEALTMDQVDLYTPDRKRILIRNLSLNLQEGEHLLIVGNSGVGKSSLLRSIAGLWTAGSGSIRRPDNDHVYFLPQRPYCTIGSLRDQLLYPMVDPEKSKHTNGSENDRVRSRWDEQSLMDENLLYVLRQVDLFDVAVRAGDGDPVRGLHTVLDWNTLSPGEQQRLAFGRVLVNRPRLIILDEATSALDIVAETRMYALLQNMAADDGVSYISVGHRPSLMTFHDKQLRISENGVHELSIIDKSSLQASNQISNVSFDRDKNYPENWGHCVFIDEITVSPNSVNIYSSYSPSLHNSTSSE